MKSFQSFCLPDFCNQVIQEKGFTAPTTIQEKVIPLFQKDKDIIGISQTGTGKTHAFLLPIMERMDITKDQVQAVITAPTRELASQIFQQAKLFVKYQPQLRISLIVGGEDRQKSIAKLNKQPHIVIGTPGRIKDLSLDSQALQITTADVVVIDEADMTLEFGYLEDIDAFLGKMKKDLQLLVFSATIPQMLRPFLKQYMKTPTIIEIDQHKVTSDQVEHILVATKHKDRIQILESMMQIIKPYICLIFCNTRKEAQSVSQQLRNDGLTIGELHGDLEPRERKKTMRRIHAMEYQFVVVTDIAARGIDIDGVSHVINMGLPNDIDFYIHRSGRCGRLKYTGICFSLYDSKEENKIVALERRGISFQNWSIENNQFTDLGPRKKRVKRVRQQTELEKKVQSIVRKPTKVKPGYKKKRKREIDTIVRKQKRTMIQQDIRRQKKERYRQAQIEKRQKEENNENW